MSEKTTPYTLGLDLDGVCGDYINAFKENVSKYTHTPISEIPEPTVWNLSKAGWPIKDDEHFFELHADAVKDGLFRAMEPMKDVSDALWKLNDLGVHIRVITHRLFVKHLHAITASDTVMWLDRHNIPYRDLCFAEAKTQIDADIYIDDGPHNIKLLRNSGAEVVVYDAPYNRNLKGPRADNWEQAYEIIAGHWAQTTNNPLPKEYRTLH